MYFSPLPLACKGVKPGDHLLLNDGREVIVEQAAEMDNIFQFVYWDRKNRVKSEWCNLHDIAWNYTEAEFAALDSEVNG
jgi:hypothetical protein